MRGDSGTETNLASASKKGFGAAWGFWLASVATWAAFPAVCHGEAAAKSPIYVLITVDTEASIEGNLTLTQDVWGDLPGRNERYGITRIMDVFDRHGLKATFFVDVYEAATYGEEAIAEVCRCIESRGHDVGLHTYPKPMFGIFALRQADVTGQTDILRSGMTMIRQWTGRDVVAHRAGGYYGNYDTLTACRNVGILADFSHNWAYHGEGFRNPTLTMNRCVVHDGVLVVPVTNYVQASLGDWQSLRILDIQASSPQEIRKVIFELYRQDVPTAVIVMHSLSLMYRGKPNARVEKVLDDLLRDLSIDPRVRVVTARQLCDIWRANPETLVGNEYLPTTGWWMTYCRAWQVLGEGWKNVAVAFGPILAFMLGGGVGIFLVRRRWRRQAAEAAS